MVAYTETRSARAIAIDRSKTARLVYGDFNQYYANSPNRSDVGGYDTRGKKGVYAPPPKQKQEEKTTTGEYAPTAQEKAELLPHFYQLNPMEQHKDLLVTKNVIRRKSEVGKWKKNPKYYDVRSIDTQPEELVEERLRVVHKHIGNIPIIPENKINKIKSRDALAGYAYQRNPQDLGKIIIRPKRIKNSGVIFSHNKVIAHELGHAYDRNVFGKGSGLVGNINIGYGVWNKIPRSIEKKNLGFGKTNNLMIGLGRKSYKEVWKPVEELTRKKLFPYNPDAVPRRHHNYRQQKEELFANWFSGFITQKNVVKRRSGHFYNIFKKQNKPLFRELRKSDFKVTRRYMGGNRLAGWGSF